MDNQEYFDQMLGLAQYNNTWSAKQAEQQMKFQERLSNTAHQREVADLKAAGLNPVLSAGGSGSSVPSGAMGNTDMSIVGALSNIVGQLINQSTALQVAQTQAQANITSSSIMANAQQYAADRAYEAQSMFPNTLAGIFSRLINDTGARSIWQNIFSTGSESQQNKILDKAVQRLAGAGSWISFGDPSKSSYNRYAAAEWLIGKLENKPSLWASFKNWLGSTWDSIKNYTDPRRGS